MFFMLKIKKQMLKYLKRIIHLVKTLGWRYLTYHPPSQKFGGYIPSIPPGIYTLDSDQRRQAAIAFCINRLL